MKKLSIALMTAGLCAMPMMGQKLWKTQHYGTMQTDTVYHVSIGPGTTETRSTVKFSTNPDTSPEYNANTTINVVEVDLTNPYVTMKVARAGKTNDAVKKSVKNIMAENTSYQHHYFAGVNGDFFGSSTCGTTVADGVFVNPGATMSNEKLPNQLVIDKNGVPVIATEIQLNGGVDPGWMVHTHETLGTVTYPDGTSDKAVRFNTNTRWEGYAVAYTEMFMKLDYDKVHTEVDANGATIMGDDGKPKQFPNQTGYTSQNHWGYEASLTPAGRNKMYIGEETEFIVGQITYNGRGGNMKVPAGGVVLSANNCGNAEHPFTNAATQMSKMKSGDRVKLTFPFTADGVAMTCRETLGGYPRIVVDNQAISAAPSGAPGDLGLAARRARTAVGYNADKTKMYIVVVEEGSKSNNGLTAKALGNLMQAMGCSEALNLDGGGSSVLHVENLGQRSLVQGSATYQRPVMNGLFAMTEAPETQEVARIEFVDKKLDIQPGRGYQPVIYAYNEYGVLVSKNLQNYTLSAPDGVATFDSSKRKMIAGQSGYFALTATYNGITTSIPVKITSTGSAGSDPSTAPSFSGDEFVPMLEKPADWVDPNQPNLYIAGKFQDWGFFNPMVVSPSKDKNLVYEFDIDFTGKTTADATAFKMTTLDPRTNGGSAAFKEPDCAWHINNGAGNSNKEILGNNKTLGLLPGNDQNITTAWNGVWHFVVDLVNKTITASTTTQRPEVNMPEKVYLTGSVESGKLEMEGDNGIFSASQVTLTGDDMAQFAFTTNTSANYGAYINGTEIDKLDEFYETTNTWSVAPGEYDVKINFNTCKVTVEPYLGKIYAELEDITPAGYNWDNYEVGETLKFSELPASTTTGTWTAPAGIYKQENFDADGQVTAVHLAGVALDAQNTTAHLEGIKNAFTIQDLGGYIGKCLVFNLKWSPGASVNNWPACDFGGQTQYKTFQLSMYPDKNKINKGDVNKPIRVRLVFQVLLRGRHNSTGVQIPNIYTSAWNENTAWATSHNGITDNVTGAEFPITEQSFYRWENEGTTIAGMPEEHINASMMGTPEPWDANGTNNEYIINGERFMVYEYDTYTNHDGGIAVHMNISNSSWNTYIFREIRFFNVLNGEEIAKQPRAQAPARAADKSFTTNTAYGSLAGTRHISYRYYTEDGVKELDINGDDINTGIDEVVTDGDNNAPIEYYNLQGVRVNNPSNGIYIKKQGSKVTKVAIR